MQSASVAMVIPITDGMYRAEQKRSRSASVPGRVRAVVWLPVAHIPAGCREPQAVGHEAAG